MKIHGCCVQFLRMFTRSEVRYFLDLLLFCDDCGQNWKLERQPVKDAANIPLISWIKVKK